MTGLWTGFLTEVVDGVLTNFREFEDERAKYFSLDIFVLPYKFYV